MIVLEKDTQDSSLMDQQKSANDKQRIAEDDLPPPYDDHIHCTFSEPTSSGSTPPAFTPSLFYGVKPTNMFSMIERNSAIRGNYVLDPRLYIPLNLLPEQPEEGKKNLKLQTRGGTIDVSVWVVGHETGVDAKARMERTSMRMYSKDGSVTVRVDGAANRDPFLLDVYSRFGRVTVHLPRSFHGMAYLTTKDGRRELSKGLRANSTTLNTDDRTMRYFIGKLTESGDPRQPHQSPVR